MNSLPTVGDHLVNRMREAGISVLTGLPTSRLDSLLVRVSQEPGFRIVLARHEGGAGYLADGFARASGRPAAVFAAGPGATNVISAVANASVNHVPMLVLTGEVSVPEYGLHSQQDTSDDGLGLGATFRRLCRCSVSIESVANARSKIDRAFRALASQARWAGARRPAARSGGRGAAGTAAWDRRASLRKSLHRTARTSPRR